MPVPLSRAHLLALLIALPAIAAACTITFIEIALWQSTAAHQGQPPVGEFADAIRRGDLDSVFLFIRAGHDPNTPVAFSDEVLTGARVVAVSPLLVAIAADRDDAMLMLMSFGASLDTPGNKFAGCLADRLGHDGLAELLAEYGGPAGAEKPCPDTAGSGPPLIPFAAR